MIRQRTLMAASVLALMVASATGCSAADAPDDSAAPSANSSESGEPQVSATPAVEPTTAFAGDDPACLYGTWTIDQAGLDAFYDQIEQLMSSQGVSATITPVGSATLEIDDAGSYTWSPTATIAFAMAEIQMDVIVGGTLNGTYTATPGTIRTEAEVDDRLEVTATVGGQAVDPTLFADQIGGSPISDSTFVCTDHTLELSSTVAATTITTLLYR